MHESATSLSLLARLRCSPEDPASWNEFVDRYGGKIRRWCRQWGLQDADAEDVTQNVLLALSKQMRTFEYRPSGRFRSWLKTIAYRAWVDFLDRRRRQGTGSGDDAVLEMLLSVEARADLLKHLDEECERNLLEDAMRLVEQRVQSHTWQAFAETAIHGKPASEVAKRLEMTVASVYKAKSNVQKRIREEIDLLEQDGESTT